MNGFSRRMLATNLGFAASEALDVLKQVLLDSTHVLFEPWLLMGNAGSASLPLVATWDSGKNVKMPANRQVDWQLTEC